METAFIKIKNCINSCTNTQQVATTRKMIYCFEYQYQMFPECDNKVTHLETLLHSKIYNL